MDFDNNRPIYIQLVEDFKIKISTGEWQAGSKIDSVRNLATAYKVNPNTIQRTYQELEREGIAIAQRRLGTYVTTDRPRTALLEQEMCQELIENFLKEMKESGVYR